MAEITEDQAAIYDRQLRVWGAEVQKRLTSARVLIAGFGGLAAEIAKNIVLAGVGSVSLLDDTSCSAYGQPNFLIPADKAGSGALSVASAAVATLQAMNPLVNVAALPGSVSDLPSRPDLLKSHDLVVLLDQPLAAVEALDVACTAAGVKLFAASVRGACSYMFANLQAHSFVVKRDKPAATAPNGAAAASSASAAAAAAPAAPTALQYVGFKQALSHPLSKLNRRSHPLFPVLKIVAQFEAKEGRQATAGDLPALEALAAAVFKSEGANIAPPLDLLRSFIEDAEPFAPLCAVLGGTAANNVIKAISATGEPVKNFFFYCLHDGLGLVEDMY